jgi:hypothetical protein
MKFTIYAAATGQVLYGGEAQDPFTLVTAGQSVLEGVSHSSGWIADGVHHELPERPSIHHTWDWAGKAWADLRTLDDLKALKNDEINAARLRANQTSFWHAGKEVACDALSRSDIDATNGYVGLYGALPEGWPGGWKARDNSYLLIADVAAWKAFFSSMFAQGNANFARAQQLKAELASAATPEQIAAITWEANA